jgi:FlaA1/EpsC-like NDP-sugar epimerase
MSTRSIVLGINDETGLNWLRIITKPMQLLLDFAVLIGAFYLAYLLRFDFSIPDREFGAAISQLPLIVFIQAVALYLSGVYKFIWRYVGLLELKRFAAAALWSTIPLLLLRIGLSETLQQFRIPLSIIIADTFLSFGGVLALRVVRREIYERHRQGGSKRISTSRRAVLLIGAGRAGVLTVNEIHGRGGIDLEVKGFIDDDRNKKGSVINGIKVLGTTDDLPRLVRELYIDHVIISISQATRRQFRRILDICEQTPVKVRVIPSLHEILQGNVKVSRIRDVQIEDLLGRAPITLDEDSLREFLTDRTILVTGAGGSIGSELVRQVAHFGPAGILLVERAEFALFNIEREIRASFPEMKISALVADINDETRMRAIFAGHRPDVVFHAAAHKHVPMMELNCGEAVKNNVLGTSLVGELAGEYGVEAFVLISTDKAVRPKSVMGATKRAAELVIQNLNLRYQTRYVAVRFGNVIGSTGSVIPIFREQICKGGPVTVTHPDMVRYFMTIPEASQLVLQAGAMGSGGEIFILDMGEPMKILDLAKETIRLSGLRPYEDIDIVFTGIRSGEKLYEELQMTGEELTKTHHPKIYIGKIVGSPPDVVKHALDRMAAVARNGWERELRRVLSDLLPEARLEIEPAVVPTNGKKSLPELMTATSTW